MVLSSIIEALQQNVFGIDVMDDPIALMTKTNPDMLYYHQAPKAPNKEKFIEAMQCEIHDHTERGHWCIIHKSKVFQNIKTF